VRSPVVETRAVKRGDLVGPAVQDDTPCRPASFLQMVDLEAHRAPYDGGQLGPRVRAKHDPVAVDDVVDREDLGTTADGNGQPSHLLGGQQLETFIPLDDHQAGIQVDKFHTVHHAPLARRKVGPKVPAVAFDDASRIGVPMSALGRPEDVLAHIPPGADVIVPLANGEPVAVLDAIEANAISLGGVRIHQMHALVERAYIRGEFGDHLRHISYFLAPATRPSYWQGTVDLVPNHFSEVPTLLRSMTKCSLVIARCSPPDRHGYLSLGTNADYTASLIGRAPFFVEVNPQMPRTFGGNQLHVTQLVGWCEHDVPLVEVPPATPGAADHAIARLVVDRISDRATVQVGIGAISAAILQALSSHRDLGVHTELLSDGMIDLVEQGVVTGIFKQRRRNKVVATFCLGTKRLYDWIDENPVVEMQAVDWVNDPRVIATEKAFVSINATTEVDLMGQCASETMAGRYWSSSGGQADFARGAMYSEGGKAFVVLHSTTSDQERSRVRVSLTEGSVVTTLKNTVDHVVTEYGVAELRGQTLAERARRLIAIAHPKFRPELTAGARQTGLMH
jgi:acyl-CoA hydrolase